MEKCVTSIDSLNPPDPLDRNIVISDEERQKETLSAHNRELGALLLHSRGHVVLRGALEEGLVAELRAAFRDILADCLANAPKEEHLLSTASATGTVFWHRKHRFRIFPRLTGPFATQHVVNNPFASAILTETLGEDYYCKSISSDTCFKGAIRQAPHRDIDFYDGAKPVGCTVNIAIMHCGLHNGPLEVWPGGSHLWHGEKFRKFGVLPNVQDGENPKVEAFAAHVPAKKIELLPGDLMIRDPGMLHRGNPNPTDEPRTMMTSSYFRRNFFYDYGDPGYNLGKGEEIYHSLEPAVREVFDYCFNWRDPLYWKLRHARAHNSRSHRRLLGAPLSIGKKMVERLRAVIRGRD